ncbi:MAG: gfo/Idh/MocA family oxidoreductase [Rhodoglobus sp.]|nr:gfo/Idh/MocA family oxidoreductase [Rhodoglobus sp.]
MNPGRFAIVGHGWRADFYLRIARQVPDQFVCVGAVTRTEERGRALEERWGIPTYRSIDELLLHQSVDVVVVSIPRTEAPDVIRDLVDRGVRVLSETPPAPSVDSLRDLWADVGDSGLVHVAEQNPFLPYFTALQRIVDDGALGEVTSAAMSFTHNYHAMSVLRRLLGIGGEPLRILATTTNEPILDSSDWRGGEGTLDVQERPHVRAILESGTRTALYDFVGNQWFNPLRPSHMLVRGSLGEANDEVVTWCDDDGTAMTSPIHRRQLGTDGSMDSAELGTISWAGKVLYTNPFPGARLSDDEIAIATCLSLSMSPDRMEGYSLADASQDQYLSLTLLETAEGANITSTSVQPWSDHLAKPTR